MYGAPRPTPRRRRSTPLLIALVGMVVVGLLLVGVALVRPGPVDGWLGGGARPTPVGEDVVPVPSAVLAAVSRDAPAPTSAGLAAVLDPLVADARLGTHVSVSVLDVTGGQALYSRTADAPSTPASTTKLVTAVTVLASRGPGYRLSTRAVAGTAPGEIVLVGGGDPTLAAGATGSYPGAGSLDDLAKKVRATGAVPTKVIVDASLFSGPLFGPGWDADIPTGGYGAPTTALMTDGARVNPKQVKPPAARSARPDLAAGQAFARALGLPASAVATGTAPAGTGVAPAKTGAPASAGAPTGASSAPAAPGTELARVESPPLSRLVEIMLAESDNVIAEALARQVALAKGEPGSYAGAASAMKKVLADLGLPAADDGLVDGSGLSRNDRITPALLTAVLAYAARPDRADLHSVFSGLPVAGYSGTLRDRFRSAGPSQPGAGLVRAKTGTLNGVASMSGIVVTREGRLLAFAVLADRVPLVGPFPAQDALDVIATALSACGCR